MSDIWLTPSIGIGTSTSIGASSAQNKQIMQVDDLFASTTTTQNMLDEISSSALSNGTNAQQSGNTTEAIRDYKLSIGLSPYSDNTVKAYQLLAGIYQKQGNNDAAIKTFQQAEKSFPQSDTIETALGDIYFGQKNYTAAEKEYAKAVKTNPSNSSDPYSLGQAYMSEGRYADAEKQFKTSIQLSSKDAGGYYTLGQLYHKMGRDSEAILQLSKAISIKPKDASSHLELGETYADMKNINKANDQMSILNNLNRSTASLLQTYMSKVAAPRIVSEYSSTAFNSSLGPNTKLSDMDSALISPNSTKVYSVQFSFSKNMDPASVQNLTNWQISRSTSSDLGGAYNFGMPINSTEASIAPMPLNVSYESDTNTATVQFSITQNASGNGTIDPEHIMFKFYGKDTVGNIMDTTANEYSGISQIV